MQAPPEASKRTFLSTVSIFGWVAFIGFAITFAVALPQVHPKGPDTLPNELTGATVGAVGLTFFFRFARCRVIASTSFLTVVQPIQRYTLPWEQVADVVVRGDGGMGIKLADQSNINVAAFGGSLIGAFTGGIQAKKARDGIKVIMANATRHEPPRPIRSKADIEWRIVLMFWAALIALSLVGWLTAQNHILI